ncbi:MAG: YciI family protein [Parvularcula sp.]|nr:YciI family protein [Parvularcula sp.]
MTAPSSPPTVPRLEEKCFLVICRDASSGNAAALRRDHLEGHLAHVEAHWQRYVTAGPIRNPGEEALSGSVFLVLAKDKADAEALMAGDPYVSSGLYGSMDVFEFTNSIGRFMGGKIWQDAASIAHRAAGGPT